MGQSFTKLAIHIIFSTKHRYPFIDAVIEPELHAYLGVVCKAMGCPPIAIGGAADHVHILCLLSKKVTLIALVEEIKKRSSKWIKEKGSRYSHFYWQGGYAAFSVQADNMEYLVGYIRNQPLHHQSGSFKDEVLLLLEKNNLQYEEKYLWD